VPGARGVTGGWFGADTIAATRVVPGSAAAVLAALDGAMSGELRFDVNRRFADRMQWSPRRGFFDAMNSQFTRGTEGFNLRLADEVAASVGVVTGQRTHVRLDATLTEMRVRARTITVVLSAFGAVLAAAAAIILRSDVAAIPVFAGIAGLIAVQQRAAYRRRAMQVGTALEQLLDRLEFGPVQRTRGIIDKLLG
jgi:hypothetical protein